MKHLKISSLNYEFWGKLKFWEGIISMTSTKKTAFKTFLVILSAICFSTALAQGIHITPIDTIRPPFPDSLWERTYVTSISDLGDLNSDGFEDLAVSYRIFPHDDYPYRVYIYYGNASGQFEPSWEYRFHSTSHVGERFASIIPFNIGDVNGNGWDDLALGMPGYYDGIIEGRGRVWFFSGGPIIDSIPDWAWSGGHAYWYHGFGCQVVGVGDWNGDGYGDFAIAAPWNDLTATGQVYLVWGGDPSDTTSYTYWTGTEYRERFGHTLISADLDGGGLKELLITAEKGYEDVASDFDTVIYEIYKYSLDTVDTVFKACFTDLLDWSYDTYVAVIPTTYRDIVYAYTHGKSDHWTPESCMLFRIESMSDSLLTTELDLRNLFDAHDSTLAPVISNVAGLKDLNGDGISEIICEYLYSKQTDLGTYRLRTSGRFYILEQSDSLDVLYISDSLFGCSSFLTSYSGLNVLDFNGDGKDEIFHGLISSYCDRNDWEIVVFTTGDWENIEEQSEISSHNSATSFFGNTIHFDMNTSARAEIDLYDITGRKIREETIDARKGSNSIPFGNLNSGVYLYRIRFDGSHEVLSGKLLNIK